jgi:hypothetical protein
MNENAGIGWMLLVFGLVIAGIGVVWILTPSIPGPVAGRYPHRAGERPLLFPAGDVPAAEYPVESVPVGHPVAARLNRLAHRPLQEQ